MEVEIGNMELIKTINDMKALSNLWSHNGQSIGFVPTMGALHDGHLSLIDIAKKYSDKVVLSIFVNPTQFAANEDYKSYPRTLERDLEVSKERGVDAVFNPTSDEIYPEGFKTEVFVNDLSEKLCGNFRPDHFSGVATVVLKLFNLINPDLAVFGEKDFQQLAIIRRMVTDLSFDLEIKAAPIVREADGLAMSSRNIYLSVIERNSATSIYRALNEAQSLVRNGEYKSSLILENVRNVIESVPHCNVQYASIFSGETLVTIEEIKDKARLAVAVICGKTRLIDNLLLERNE